MEQRFKKGDVVVLKSGGPKMTISDDKKGGDLKLGYIFNGNYSCAWFDSKNVQCYGVFHQDTLEFYM